MRSEFETARQFFAFFFCSSENLQGTRVPGRTARSSHRTGHRITGVQSGRSPYTSAALVQGRKGDQSRRRFRSHRQPRRSHFFGDLRLRGCELHGEGHLQLQGARRG